MSQSVAVCRARGRLAVVVSTVLAAACGSGSERPAAPGSSRSAGIPGTSFGVTVMRPTGGTITSGDGAIACGTGGALCSAQYPWSARVVLTAVPDPGYMLGTWVGDCQYNGACVLDTSKYGADKLVGAVFGLGGSVPHGNFSSPAIHGPAFLDRLAGLPNTYDCSSSSCHGPTYDGSGLALSCNACHAAAGWSSWLTNCTFCHGTRVKSGFAVETGLAKAAPPDAVAERLGGAAAPERTGAHAQHLGGTTAAGDAWSRPLPCAVCHPIPADVSHVRGSTARAAVTLSGAGEASLPTLLGSYDEAAGTCSTYCHGDGRSQGFSPAFATTVLACDGCHGVPPGTGHPYAGTDLTRCAGCHPQTMAPDGRILAGGGAHVDGVIQGTPACDACHAFPPATGAHVKHFGLAGSSSSGYGDTRALQDMFPGATPTSAPGVYAFGCGTCHPLDFARHQDGRVDVALYDAAAPAGSLKRRAAPAAAYDRATGSCSGVYCHSTGQETPTYRPTPAWTSTTPLTCGGCHDNPPRYASGGPGSTTANSHLAVDDYAWVVGHFGGIGGVGHAGRHGTAGSTEAAITCQTCHAETTDPASTGVSGFYWLDTTGAYEFAGTDPAQEPVACTGCHDGIGNAVAQAGRVLPLRHVNGARDVVFDARTTIGVAIPYLPGPPSAPERPYYRTGDTTTSWLETVVNGSTTSFHLGAARYDPATKSCAVACHAVAPGSGLTPVWGTAFLWNCSYCHAY